MLQALQEHVPHLPRLLGWDALAEPLAGLTHLLLIAPAGQHLGSDTSASVIHAAAVDVAQAIGALAAHGWLHR